MTKLKNIGQCLLVVLVSIVFLPIVIILAIVFIFLVIFDKTDYSDIMKDIN
jgi:hypothetical protein